ncbi:carboxypeptidase-like regulatory domain-containing protein [Desulfonema magnum]|uniref:UPF0560 n=1 Tax=Desulfonema magnum TaxID=45655 RepID=A0A975C0V1_9BACT|nr:carboxypeptidase-like regulatory domain-containing protein [Desulfonema magnum]QTA93925.1 UPF0560 [Desulfonema magnum]
MGNTLKNNRIIVGVLLFAFISVFTSASFAETEITRDVQLIKSRLNYDRQAKVSYVNVSLKNISENHILKAPIRVLIESISSNDVTVENADGTNNGKPYFEYSLSDDLLPGQMTGSKKWKFSNQRKKRFHYTFSVQGEEVQTYDSDTDGTPDSEDACPGDPNKTAPGDCGCGVADTDTDKDGSADCHDDCPNDANKTAPGTCGCGVADTDSDNDGVPNCNDNCPNDPGKTDPGVCGCGVADTDSDRDGTLNCKDGCPNDRNKTAPGQCGCGKADADSDGDGTLNCKDGCPSDPGKTSPGTCGCGVADSSSDRDSDGTIDCLDGCPDDPDKTSPGGCGCGNPDTNSDGDSKPDCTDGCPNDPNKTAPGTCGCGNPDTDTDADGVADCKDACSDTPSGVSVDAEGCALISITGHVRSAGLRISSAQVKIGSDSVPTDGNGNFSNQVSEKDILNGSGGDVLPIEVTADGYATGYSKVACFSQKAAYHVEITMIPVSQEITDKDDVTSGVDIKKDGEKIGELKIPASALPAGVTQVTGNVSYIDPTTSDLDAFPGNDFLAVRESGTTATLESIGLMEFDLKDQNGNPVTTLSGNATVCMKVPDGLNVSEGETIPLWWYNPDDGLWHEEGQGTVEKRDGDGLWMCGSVNHFTWWNYDRPIEMHACFKFTFVNESDNSPVNLNWFAEGVDFSGGAPERPCNCDGDDPSPCPDKQISSLTVMKGGKIRVRTTISGTRYYLKDDGDGTFSLVTNTDNGTVFDAPNIQGSCYFNEGVENCVPLDGDDGILPLGGINYAPDVLSLTVPEKLDPGETVAITAQVADTEGDNVSVSWSAICGTISDQNPAGEASVTPPLTATANFTAPPKGAICKITLTAQENRAEGNISEASAWVWVGDTPTGTIEGTLYGPDGQPAAGIQIQLQEGDGGDGEYSRTVTTDSDGNYVFDDVPCCRIENDEYGFYCQGFYGSFSVDMDINGTTWHKEQDTSFSCCGEFCWDDGGAEYNSNCTQHIYWPTLWATVQGTAHDEFGNPVEAGTEIQFENWDYAGYYEHIMNASIPSADGVYGPVSIPVGNEVNIFYELNETKGKAYVTALYNGQEISSDFGPKSPGIVEGYVYNDNGNPVSGVQVRSVFNTTTNGSGYYRITNVPMGPIYGVNTSSYGSNSALITVGGETLTIDINGPDCVVTGTLYDWDGQVKPNVEIQLSVNRNPFTATTNANGQFIFNNVTTGRGYFSLGNDEDLYNDAFTITQSNSTVTVDPQITPPDPEDCGYDCVK